MSRRELDRKRLLDRAIQQKYVAEELRTRDDTLTAAPEPFKIHPWNWYK